MITFSMESQSPPDMGFEHLLDLDGNIEVQNDAGYWIKMDVSRVDVTVERPRGIKPEGSRFKHAGKRYSYDHRHRHSKDNGVLYEFDTAYQLLRDFYAEVR